MSRSRSSQKLILACTAAFLTLALSGPTFRCQSPEYPYCPQTTPGAGEPGICASYTSDTSAWWSQSPEALSCLLSSEQFDYGLDGWFWFSSLIEPSGTTSAYCLAISRTDFTDADGVPFSSFYASGVGFNHPLLGRYLMGGCQTADTTRVTVTQNPWKVTTACPEGRGTVSMELLSGQMGRPGARYLLSSEGPNQFGEPMTTRVTVVDRMGAVNQGYGPASYYPQFFSPLQSRRIRKEFGGWVDAYLSGTQDPMACQGEHYYSLALMDIEEFQIGVGTQPSFATGTRGNAWVDYTLMSFNNQMKSMEEKSSWFWFAIEFPERGEAMMVMKLDTAAGRMKTARLFRENGPTTPNGAQSAVAEWKASKIKIEPIPGTLWKSPTTGLEYYTGYRIKLGGKSAAGRGDLTLRMVMEDQEFPVGNTVSYQGLMKVKGTIGGKSYEGMAWAELQPEGHL